MEQNAACHEFSSLSWTQVRDLPPASHLALLPIGAMEAHGPHLPLSTDVIIAQGMARALGQKLVARGESSVILHPIAYSSAPFAQPFPGTISLRPSTMKCVLLDLAAQVHGQGFRKLLFCNAHLDPSHIELLRQVEAEFEERAPGWLVFPDITRRRNAQRLSEEFQSGACHAGQYESSIVLAERPGWVDEEAMRALPDNMHSLVEAVREGKRDFVESGGPQAYFGSPSRASAQEGRESLEMLANIALDAL